MKTIEQINSELQERLIDVINIEIWHFEDMPNDIRLTIKGCLTINNLVDITGYFGGTAYVHNDERHLTVGIRDLNNQTEGL